MTSPSELNIDLGAFGVDLLFHIGAGVLLGKLLALRLKGPANKYWLVAVLPYCALGTLSLLFQLMAVHQFMFFEELAPGWVQIARNLVLTL